MQNVFIEQPEFINNDPRANRPATIGYNTNPAFMQTRHRLLLPKKLIENKRVLDLGSCNAASGAWCLSRGAAFYTGVEFQESFVKSSAEALAKYYPQDKWRIEQSSIEDYLSANKEVFDVVLASGVLYSFTDPIGILNSMAEIANALVIESMHPKTFKITEHLKRTTKRAFLQSQEYTRFIENEPFIAVGRQGMITPNKKTIFFNGTKPSMGTIKFIVVNAGFRYVDELNQRLKAKLPDVYSPYDRFGLLFIRAKNLAPEEYGFASAVLKRTVTPLICKNRKELIDYLTWLSGELESKAQMELSEEVRIVISYGNGSPPEFLHEAQAILKKVRDQCVGLLNDSYLKDVASVIEQIDAISRRLNILEQ